MLRYFCSNTDPRFLGKTKLMKLFYFADFLHVKKYGTSITRDVYFHLEHGPIPSTILNLVNSVIDEPEDAILSDTITVNQKPGFKMHQIQCVKGFSEDDKKYFSDKELEILERVVERFGDKPTKLMEDASHQEAPWRLTTEGEEIPYVLATKDEDCRTTAEEIELLSRI